MARIAGVNVPDQKHVVIALTSIYGVGRTISKNVCVDAGISPDTKVRDLTALSELVNLEKLYLTSNLVPLLQITNLEKINSRLNIYR